MRDISEYTALVRRRIKEKNTERKKRKDLALLLSALLVGAVLLSATALPAMIKGNNKSKDANDRGNDTYGISLPSENTISQNSKSGSVPDAEADTEPGRYDETSDEKSDGTPDETPDGTPEEPGQSDGTPEEPGQSDETPDPEPTGAYPAMIMVNDELYYMKNVTVDRSSVGNVSGYIDSYTDSVPVRNGMNNFSKKTGLPYAEIPEGIVVNIDGEWQLFKAEKPGD